MFKLILSTMIILSSFCSADSYFDNDKVYIDPDSFTANTKGDEFRIHIGHNVWLVTNTIHRDSTGMFSYESSLKRSTRDGVSAAYEQQWKCPYCYRFWPMGKPCGNPNCPGKFK